MKHAYQRLITVILLCSFTLSFDQLSEIPANPEKRNTLVLLDNLIYQTTHSKFFDHLRAQGHKLTIKYAREDMISNGQISLQRERKYMYDNLILMCTSLADLPETKTFNIKQFFDDGNNVFFIFDFDTTDYFRRLANQFGFKISARGEYLVDYKNAIDRTEPNVFKVSQFRDVDFLAEGVEDDIVYNGINLGMTHFDNDQISIFARGNLHTAAITYDASGKKKFGNMGKHNLLVIGIQGLNNARCLVSGSIDMFSNELDELSGGNNNVFAGNLLGWVSHQRGVVMKTKHSHSCVDKNGEDNDCPVRSNFRFSIDVKYIFLIFSWFTGTGEQAPGSHTAMMGSTSKL